MKYPIKQWYPIQITEQLYVDRIDRFAVGGLPWGDNGYTTNLTDGQKIIKEYYKKINKEHYSSDNDERSVMDNAIGVAVNSSGSSTLSHRVIAIWFFIISLARRSRVAANKWGDYQFRY